jgi:hypothetical protein
MTRGRIAPRILSDDGARHLAREVQEACLRAALKGYEQAGLSGLCAEGRWEMAIDAIRALDLGSVVASSPRLQRLPTTTPE